MNPLYLGVDIAGAKNTWMVALSPEKDGLVVVDGPRKASLVTAVDYCEENNVVAATIDAQLTAALSEENGLRRSDMELRDMLLEGKVAAAGWSPQRASWPSRYAVVCSRSTSRQR